MTIKVYKGRITVLGDAVSSAGQFTASFTYSYIELEGGQLIRQFRAMSGLDGHVKSAFKEDEQIELHVNEESKGVPNPGAALLAIRRGDGRLYATHIPSMPFAYNIAPLLLFVAGVFLLPVFLIGLLPWFMAWKIHKAKKAISEVRDYIGSLQGAIEI